MKYYKSEDGKIIDKEGRDFLVLNGLSSLNGLTEVDQDYIDSIPPLEDDNSENEYSWAKSEIERSIIQLSKCEFAEAYPLDDMATCVGTSEEWRRYIIKLRYYATYNETDGYSLRLDDRPTF